MIRLWPRSLKGQLLLAVALALLLAQSFSALLLYRAQYERMEAAMVHAVAFRLLSATRGEIFRPRRGGRPPRDIEDYPRSMRLERAAGSPLMAGEVRDSHAEDELRHILVEQGFGAGEIVIARRAVNRDAVALRRAERRAEIAGHSERRHRWLMIAGVQQQPGSDRWYIVRVLVPPGERMLLFTLIGQTLLIYAVIFGAIALILRRITRPLAALTGRLERFADTRDAGGQLEPEGPEDVRRLIVAHNLMEDRIAALLDEKDLMLGAIGHDLKTPLAALRVRIESVEDEHERGKMAATIEDIVRTLDDILSLARVGRPRDPLEQSELSALVASVVEEYEDMGDPVELGEITRIVLPIRATWLRRALRNLISNALRYGGGAQVSLLREGNMAIMRIDDDGPGIAESDIERMQEPFTRGEPSRNSLTGGAGLGLALARAIAEQHGGALHLGNRDGAAGGLRAELRLPL